MPDIMTLKDRVKLFCERKNIAVTKFERDANLSNGYFRDTTSRMGDEKIERIHRAFPDLNMDWLITGNGEMLVAEQGVAQIVTTASRIEQTAIVRENEEVEVDIEGLMLDTNTAPKDIAQIIGEDIEYLRRCNSRLYPRHIMKLQDRFGDALIEKYAKYRNVVEAEIVESFLVVPEAVNAEPNANIEEVIEEDGTELEAISPNLLLSNKKVSVAEQIKGTSMLPTFQPNDWVFIRFLKDKMKIISGKTYYLKCRNRPTMIRKVKFEGADKLRLIAKNSEYDDIIICRSDIINIGNVIALFRMTFGDQYSELEELRREKDAEREKKDSQIDKMLEMMDKQAEQQNKLIDYITKER
jgi:hypothetical protein